MLVFSLCVLGVIGCIIAVVLHEISIIEGINQQEATVPKLRVLYTEIIGPYSNVYKKTSLIEKAVKDKFGADISQCPCFGIYYDNPKITPKNKTRAIVGKIIDITEERDFSQACEGLHIQDIPGGEKALALDIKFRNSAGITCGIIRIYKRIESFLKEKKGEMKGTLEVYSKGKITVYCVLQEPHGNIWVPFEN